MKREGKINHKALEAQRACIENFFSETSMQHGNFPQNQGTLQIFKKHFEVVQEITQDFFKF